MTHLDSNSFDLSHSVKMSSKFGLIYPVMWEECIPGDKHYISCYGLNRLAPLVAPVMQRFDIFFHTFFVPFRLLWDNYEDYMTGGDNSTPTTTLTANTTPTATSTEYTQQQTRPENNAHQYT